jgi:phosphoribosylanthranilate isomerase
VLAGAGDADGVEVAIGYWSGHDGAGKGLRSCRNVPEYSGSVQPMRVIFSRKGAFLGFLTRMPVDKNKSVLEKRAPRVLIVHGDVETTRLIRETLESFTSSVIESTPNPEYAFELALMREYDLFILQMEMPVLPGVLLYDLISKAYRYAHGGEEVPPGVVYTSEPSGESDELRRDARVKGVLAEPIRIESVLRCVEGIFPTRTGEGSGVEGVSAKSEAMQPRRTVAGVTGSAMVERPADALEFLDKAASSGTAAIKICGLTTEAESRAVMNLGVDALGFNMWTESKRYFGVPEAHPWLKELAGEICRVGVFVNAERDEIIRRVDEGWIDAAQLHGDETWEYCSELRDEGIPFIKAIGVKDESSLGELRAYATPYLLLDAYAPEERGGTGKTFEWQLARDVCHDYPDLRIVLSGGLNPENVRSAVKKVEPAGVDVASGVEKRPGYKDLEKVEAFIRGVW